MDLFSSPEGKFSEPTSLDIIDGELLIWTQLELPYSNARVMDHLVADTPWRSESVTLYGKQHLQPRLSAVYGSSPYTYSGLTIDPLPWTPLLLAIKESVEHSSGYQFNSVLLNFYRNERDSIGMHSDDEKELGRNPVVASVSLGCTRTFVLRHKRTKESIKLDLTDGSMLLMAGAMQHNWQHGINKSTRSLGERVNLTFRSILLQDKDGKH